ncbi:hypothetical protein GCM10027605_31960 [Micromonospora zhanjiangensis]
MVDALVDLYAVVYAESPYSEGPDQVARFRHGIPDDTTRDGFELVVAADETGTVVGAAYGWTMPTGKWWSRATTAGPVHVVAADKLAVMEWLVHPGHRGRGIGAGLMRRLLADRRERWATLASDPRSAARRMYERAGWVQVGESTLPWGAPMHLLAIEIKKLCQDRQLIDTLKYVE